jgi:hypothetical protein
MIPLSTQVTSELAARSGISSRTRRPASFRRRTLGSCELHSRAMRHVSVATVSICHVES